MPAKILIVEEQGSARRAMRNCLESMFPQCRVLEAASGEAALALIRIESPCVILTDVSVSGMSTAYVRQRELGEKDGALERLGPGEREILRLVVEGKSSAEIASILSLSPKTV